VKPSAIYLKDNTNTLFVIQTNMFLGFNHKTTDILLKMKTAYGCQKLMDHV